MVDNARGVIERWISLWRAIRERDSDWEREKEKGERETDRERERDGERRPSAPAK